MGYLYKNKAYLYNEAYCSYEDAQVANAGYVV